MQKVCLTGRSGIYMNAVLEVEKELLIGRDANMCQLVYPETAKEISGMHCKIQNINGNVCLIDLHSTNGTFLIDGTRIKPDMPRTMTSGQGFYLGSRENAFDIIIENVESAAEGNGSRALRLKQDRNGSDKNGAGAEAGKAYTASQKGRAGVCPVCGCDNCQVINETTTSGKDFSAGKACCGAVLLGPFGILCGACGKGKQTQNAAYWICPQCGHKFKV